MRFDREIQKTLLPLMQIYQQDCIFSGDFYFENEARDASRGDEWIMIHRTLKETREELSEWYLRARFCW